MDKQKSLQILQKCITKLNSTSDNELMELINRAHEYCVELKNPNTSKGQFEFILPYENENCRQFTIELMTISDSVVKFVNSDKIVLDYGNPMQTCEYGIDVA